MALQPPDMLSVQRVLIIKMSALGDVIHALPVAAALKETFPHLEISWFVEEQLAPLLTGNPCLTDVMTLKKYRGSALFTPHWVKYIGQRVRDVHRRKFDLTLDLQGLTKSAIVAAASGAKCRLGYHWLREAAAMIEQPVPRLPTSIHIVDQYLDVARFLGAKAETPQFPFHIPEADEMAAEAMLCEQGIAPNAPFIALNPASANAIKQWGNERYAAFSDALYSEHGLPSVLLTADVEVAATVTAAARCPIVSLAGRTNLKQLASVLKRCAVHVCGDTGSGHLAAALGRPVVSIIGPTDPERVCPYGQRENALSHRENCGAACDWRHCEHKHPPCLDAVSVAEVLERTVRLLPGNRSLDDR